MPLTPADIHNMSFKKSTLGRRGYAEEQVDALLDEVTAEMIELLDSNDALRAQVRQADAAGKRAASDELDRERQACDAAETAARGLRGRLDDARAAAAADRAGDDGGPILAMARRTAGRGVDDADRQARQLLADAREQSERIGRQAQAAAQDIAEESRRRDSAARTALRERHASLVREIGELTEFAESYLAALRDHVRHQAGL
ncbi:DivIVA domain-containing protein [Actinoplanes sp. KI2]|uniref:DivIVA domain-containing protein n=1 Tax=Actinoplanes sp. KI2 TaxID=2983315 RepID=UPI0021D5BB88|nr:DivIVA domain-containing protein [Actinoplanes sp. KI2]MCU7722493.1 DivIVA domain-containing protein [Actinoplanes sp. KI2]